MNTLYDTRHMFTPGRGLFCNMGGNMMNSVCGDDGRARERQAALVVARRLVHALARLAEH